MKLRPQTKKNLKIIFFVLIFLFAAVAMIGCNAEDNRTQKVCFRIDGQVYTYKSVSADGSFDMPEDPEKDGYRFEGWYVGKDGKGIKIDSDTRLVDQGYLVTVSARFSLIGKDKISYVLNGGVNAVDNPTVCYDTMTGDNAIALNAPTKHVLDKTEYSSVDDCVRRTEYYRIYEFLGWYSDPHLTKKVSKIEYGGTDVTLYAAWDEEYEEKVVVEDSELFVSGDFVYMGSYPQTLVDDEAVDSALTALVTDLPDALNSNGWTAYDFFINNERVDFTWYTDITFEGQKYRGVYFTAYRTDNVDYIPSGVYRQQENGYECLEIYWFKYEPIKWRVLKKNDGKALIYSESIIDTVSWQDTLIADGKKKFVNDGIAPEGTYANNYEYSTIRRVLNGEFYNTAFSSETAELILESFVDNSVVTSFVNPNPYLCNDVIDKVFLLSYKDLIVSDYGFSTSYSEHDAARRKSGTDYAKALGLRHTTDEYAEYAAYWLRTPFYDSQNVAHIVRETGYSTAIYSVDESCVGMVPAMYITLD